MKTINLKSVRDSQAEKIEAQKNTGFAVMDRSTADQDVLYVSTTLDDKEIFSLPCSNIIFYGGLAKIKRFIINLPKEDLFNQIKKIYPNDKVNWIE